MQPFTKLALPPLSNTAWPCPLNVQATVMLLHSYTPFFGYCVGFLIGSSKEGAGFSLTATWKEAGRRYVCPCVSLCDFLAVWESLTDRHFISVCYWEFSFKLIVHLASGDTFSQVCLHYLLKSHPCHPKLKPSFDARCFMLYVSRCFLVTLKWGRKKKPTLAMFNSGTCHYKIKIENHVKLKIKIKLL